ncbi:hypothetical protein DFA_12010 [Cavenderia fasciculata]|uniref:Ankyrin repeat-containing protein n=1 Tax=Cavenderia fasciculata TaxID=261658 RepID=F4QF86_CACFS|nr:uncharacterized protein DFA_12010 [Cavenderia fasciculata]EGG14240.1 hypothetical protein DFA_12010 [Cavenderia fasciculata]|eukprot:XP_004350949.1 hypothetical protein DFA_12010 [Cavenderia fasciculata]
MDRVITFLDIYRISYIRNKVFWLMENELYKTEKKLFNHQTLKSNTFIKGKQLIKLSSIVLFQKYALPWDFIKHYIPKETLGSLDLKCRSKMINGYICHPNATLETLIHLLDWSPDFIYDGSTTEIMLGNGNYEMTLYLAQRLTQQQLNIDVYSLESVCKSGSNQSIELARWLIETYPKFEWQGELIDSACIGGNLELVKWLDNNKSINVTSTIRAIDSAARFGYLDIIKYLYTNGTKKCSDQAIIQATINGHLDIVKFITENCGQNKITNHAFIAAILNDRLDILQYLQDNAPSGIAYTVDAMRTATGRGNFEMIKWLHKNRTERFPKHSIQNAAENGHFEIVQFLVEDGIEWSGQAIIEAASNSHFNIVEYLFQKRKEGFKSIVVPIDSIAKNGRLDIIHYLEENQVELSTTNSLYLAASAGHIEVAKHLMEKKYDTYFTHLLAAAAHNGHLDMVKYLHDHIERLDYPYAPLNSGSAQGHIEVVKFLHSAGYKGTKFAMEDAAKNGHLEVVRFLNEHTTEGMVIDAMRKAAKEGHLSVAQYLFQYTTESDNACDETTLKETLENGYLSTAHFLFNNNNNRVYPHDSKVECQINRIIDRL